MRKRLILHEIWFPCLKFFTSYSIDGRVFLRICWKWPYSLFRLLNNFSVHWDWLLITWGPFQDIQTIQNRSEMESQWMIWLHPMISLTPIHITFSWAIAQSFLVYNRRFVSELIEYACWDTRKSMQGHQFERKRAETWWIWCVTSIIADINRKLITRLICIQWKFTTPDRIAFLSNFCSCKGSFFFSTIEVFTCYKVINTFKW